MLELARDALPPKLAEARGQGLDRWEVEEARVQELELEELARCPLSSQRLRKVGVSGIGALGRTEVMKRVTRDYLS